MVFETLRKKYGEQIEPIKKGGLLMSRLPAKSRRGFLRKVEGATERMTGKKGTRRADIAFAMYDPKDTRPQFAENWVYIDAEYKTFGYL